jgi:hypothetical protein
LATAERSAVADFSLTIGGERRMAVCFWVVVNGQYCGGNGKFVRADVPLLSLIGDNGKEKSNEV